MNRWSVPALRKSAALICAGALALVAACGGGGGASTSTPGAMASSYSQGPISGFGSVIVNGVRWDDSAATVTDDDGNAASSSALKLGMMVNVGGDGVDANAGTGKAHSLKYGSEVLGPIASLDSTAGTLVVLGQTVSVTTTTVFDTTITGGLAGLAAGDVVEVYGLYDATANSVVATRIELDTGATTYKLHGTVAALDTAAKTFMLGTEIVSYANTPGVPSTLANGLQVKVRLEKTQVNGAWVADKLKILGLDTPNQSDADVEGVISVWTSTTSFEINGLKIDATNASFPDGTAGVVLGARVEVKGTVTDGVLVATVVHLDGDGHHGGGRQPRPFELHGAMGSLDTTALTFTLRGLTVDYSSAALVFQGGTAANLADGVKVEVKGTLSADQTKIVATLIKFE